MTLQELKERVDELLEEVGPNTPLLDEVGGFVGVTLELERVYGDNQVVTVTVDS